MAESSRFKGSRWSLHGMTALVTGGTRGTGNATVDEFAGLGARVHTCSTNEEELNKCLKEWEAKGFVVTGSVCDASCRVRIEKLIEEVGCVFNGKLTILASNPVKTWSLKKLTTVYSVEESSKVMATNFKSEYHLSQIAHPLLKASGAGSLVFIFSVAGLVHVGTGSIFGAMKVLARNLACEWAKDNISGRTVLHGGISEPRLWNTCSMTRYFYTKLSLEPLSSALEIQKKSRSWWGFLCLPAAAYITGQVISVDGEFTFGVRCCRMKST